MLAATILMIVVSLLPYLDIFINLFWDTSQIKMQRFNNFSVAVWSFSVTLYAPLILAVSKLKPWWPSYIIHIYVSISMFCSFLYLERNIDVKSEWLFRMNLLILSFVIVIVVKFIHDYYKLLKLKEEVFHEIELIKSHVPENQNN